MEVELRQGPVADVLLGREIEYQALGQFVGDRCAFLDGKAWACDRLYPVQGFADAGLSLGEGARLFAGVAAFVEQVCQFGWKGLVVQSQHSFLGLDAGEADLGGEGKHVGRQAGGQQRLGRAIRPLGLGLAEPGRQGAKQIPVGGDENIREGHGGSLLGPEAGGSA